jgi:hypothetical protein
MCSVDADSSPDPDFPFAAQARRFVYMTVQCQQWLPRLNKSLHCDAAYVNIQRNVLVSPPIECRSV